MTFDDQPPEKLRSLLRIKAEGAIWTLIFGAVFFLLFYSLSRDSFMRANPLQNIMPAEHWAMSGVWILTVFSTFLFTKVYYAFNPDLQTNQMEVQRKTWSDVQQLKKWCKHADERLEYIVDCVEPYEPKVKPLPPSKRKQEPAPVIQYLEVDD